MSVQSGKYLGGVFFDKNDDGSQFLIGVAVFIAIFGVILCALVSIELLLFRKLKFQVHRLVFILMVLQTITSLAFAVYWAPSSFNQASGKILFKCPHWTAGNIFIVLQYVGLLGTLLIEAMMVSFASYSLFYMKREVTHAIEFTSYGGIAVIMSISFVLNLTEWLSITEHSICDYNRSEATRRINDYIRKTDPIIVVLVAIIWVAYFTLFTMRRRQTTKWKHMLEDSNSVERASEKHVKARLVEVHQDIVGSVVDVMQKQMLAFAITSLGYVALFLAMIVGVSSNTEYIMFICSILILRNTQAALQALAYMLSKENIGNFKWQAWESRFRRDTQTHRRHVHFENDAEEWVPALAGPKEDNIAYAAM
eukprot:m.217931 g.217931  ORF g.217931 m.217931 type:complete len:366 (+) comp15894_c3_seq5:289-1386(+)